ncbi:2-dehydro-3-deoxygalactonokinase [Allosphingosinicella flava]|uniref:2-dehydro-3-deoxygalactonokinase n=1 Tax=Allosphingosinicella flava TaxID=2771430 RepID=A0A7T2GII2_9SPHN|nr:2-dehydro-3-deoxygalactonokinase [Sphingosinicella flava]QPQ54347.1 2-dehydro-3-deoxygalactonokinase [Sphingosinicella flava]
MGWRGNCIAVDWGTTNRRAYLLDGAGQLIGKMEDDLGVLSVPCGGFPAAVADIQSRFGPHPVLLAGMIGSNRGWIETAYVACPAGIADLAPAIRWVVPGEIGIVPGLSSGEGAPADVMRGEEVQALGAVAAGLVPRDALLCHPGTHCKWMVLEDGRIARFRTMMTGEMFSLLKNGSILSPQLGGTIAANPSFIAGATEGLQGGDLLSGLFSIRARYVLGRPDEGAASFASGLLIGSDVRGGLAFDGPGPVALVGRPDLCALYARVLERAGREAIEVDGAAAFRAGIHALREML